MNSLHSQGIKRLAEVLVVEAVAEDGLVEAVSLSMEYENRVWVLGVQWHPEWKFDSNPISRKIFHEFGEQVRRFVSLRK